MFILIFENFLDCDFEFVSFIPLICQLTSGCSFRNKLKGYSKHFHITPNHEKPEVIEEDLDLLIEKKRRSEEKEERFRDLKE